MGSDFTKPMKNSWVNWQHRPLIPSNPQETDNGVWICYSVEVSNELEVASKDAKDEPMYSIQQSPLYLGDQILFCGDLAERLGGPFVHRNKTNKSLKELRRVAYTYVFQQDKNDFTSQQLTAKDVNEKAVTISEPSIQKLMSALYELIYNDYYVDEGVTSITGFVATETKYGSSNDPCALDEFFTMQVTDTQNKLVDIVIQKHEIPLNDIETMIEHELKNTDSKVAALQTEEARLGLGVELVSRTIVCANGGRFARVTTELDTTQSRKKLKK